MVKMETLTASHETSDAEDDRQHSSTIGHTVVFKVIGCTKEHVCQETLRRVRDTLDQGQNVPVTLSPEPTIQLTRKQLLLPAMSAANVKELCMSLMKF